MVLDSSQNVIYLNEEGRILLGGFDLSQVIGKPLGIATGRGVDPALQTAIDETLRTRVPMRMRARSTATGRSYEIGMYPSDGGGVTISYQNVTNRVITEAVTRAQKQALEMAISGESLERILNFLCDTVENLAGTDVRMAILLAQGDHLKLAAAPNLPPDYCAVIDGMKIEEGMGACGTAAFRGSHVITTDVETDPLWSNFREIALRENLRACWAAPVKGTAGKVIALFAIYYDHAWNPSESDQALVELVSHTTSQIVETYQQVAERRRAEAELRDEIEINEALNHVSNVIATEMDLDTVVQAITDASVLVSEADFGAFFYNVINEHKETYTLYALSGAPREAFERFPMPSNTAVFEPTFRGTAVLRLDDVTKDERYGKSPPYHGMPPGHLPVRSYLAVPVVSRSGEVHGGLFFGHPEVGRFTARHEQLVTGLAAQAAIAIDNRRLYEELHETARRLGLALSAAKLGAWTWNARTDIVDFSDRAAEIFGIPPGPYMTWTAMQGILHEEDAQMARAAVEEAIKNRSAYDVEYRVLANDKTIWVSAKGSAQYDLSGEVVGMHGIVQDISERKALEAELVARAAELIEADRRKDDFLATLAHELRNPLAPIRSGLDLMHLHENDPSALAQVRGVMERQVDQIVRLVDDLLDVSRITRGTVKLQYDHVEISSILRTAIESGLPGIAAKGHNLSIDQPELPAFVRVDSARMAQILSNLLFNAVRYTPNGGNISVSAKIEGAEIVFRVKDDGIGLSPDMTERVFEMFTQVERAGNRPSAGLGIGLTITKRLVELHGGSIEVISAGIGQGCEFVVRIPTGPEQNVTTSSPSESQSLTKQLRIVVADDNEDAASMLRVMLGKLGHEVHLGFDGEEAISLGDEHSPNVVILDIGMPRMDGYEAARQIRTRGWGKDAFLIAITGWGQPDDRRQTMDAGFDRHLTKPVQLSALQKVLEEVPTRSTGG